MHSALHRFAVPLVATLGLTLAGCGENAADQAASSTVAATDEATDNGPENAPGIALSDAVVQLPAVAGRPGVAYFSVRNGTTSARKLASVHVEGTGRTEMHETKSENGVTRMAQVSEVVLEPAQSLAFAPGGHHVMLFDLDPGLKAGSTAELTITLDNGDKSSVTATVRSIGDAGADHSSGHDMKHDM